MNPAPAPTRTPTSIAVVCGSCGAHIHFGMPPGQVVDDVHLLRITRGFRVHIITGCGAG